MRRIVYFRRNFFRFCYPSRTIEGQFTIGNHKFLCSNFVVEGTINRQYVAFHCSCAQFNIEVARLFNFPISDGFAIQLKAFAAFQCISIIPITARKCVTFQRICKNCIRRTTVCTFQFTNRIRGVLNFNFRQGYPCGAIPLEFAVFNDVFYCGCSIAEYTANLQNGIYVCGCAQIHVEFVTNRFHAVYHADHRAVYGDTVARNVIKCIIPAADRQVYARKNAITIRSRSIGNVYDCAKVIFRIGYVFFPLGTSPGKCAFFNHILCRCRFAYEGTADGYNVTRLQFVKQ